MTHIQHSVRVTRTPDDVAAVALDWSQDTLWRASVRRMTVRPAGRAVTGQQVVDQLSVLGLPLTTPTRIDLATSRSASWSGGSNRLQARGRRTVEDEDGATCLTTEVDVRLRGALRALTPVLATVYRRTAGRDLRRLRTFLQAEGTPTR